MVCKGGSMTKGGLYWKKCEWEIVPVEGKNGILPGTQDIEYLRIPVVLVPPLALVLGLSLYLFLPLIGFVMLLFVLVKKIWAGFAAATLQHDAEECVSDFQESPETSQPARIRQGGGVS